MSIEAVGRRRALGRGLGALIPHSVPSDDRAQPVAAQLSAIHRNPRQPRETFADEGIEELANSIQEKGILQPLLVRRAADGFELIAGERRFRAAQRLGLKEVPVVVRDATDSDMLEMALIENIQRENLNPIEEAKAYRRLIDEFDLTQEEIAKRVGKNRSTVTNTLRLLQLPDAVKKEIQRGALSAGHARALVNAGSAAAQTQLGQEIVSRRLTVRQTEQLVKRNARESNNIEQRSIEQRLTELLGTRVRLVGRRNGSGKIEIEYYSLDGLNGLINRLGA